MVCGFCDLVGGFPWVLILGFGLLVSLLALGFWATYEPWWFAI